MIAVKAAVTAVTNDSGLQGGGDGVCENIVANTAYTAVTKHERQMRRPHR